MRICTSLFFQRSDQRNFSAAFKRVCYPFPWRIHGAAIYGVPWIPSTKTPVMLAFKQTSTSRIRHGFWTPFRHERYESSELGQFPGMVVAPFRQHHFCRATLSTPVTTKRIERPRQRRARAVAETAVQTAHQRGHPEHDMISMLYLSIYVRIWSYIWSY